MSAQAVSSTSYKLQPESEQAPAPIMVRAERLGKAFDLRPVLRGVSFTLAAGRVLALLGPNGTGKTTLLRILATLVRPTTGTVEVAGFDVVRDANVLRHVVGYVGHQPHVYDDLTARENLLFFARMYGLRDGAKRADALLQRVGLHTRANDRVRTFSRGQTQRLALARGILHEPRILLLDEPDTGLDAQATDLLTELIRERAGAGLTTIFTTHLLDRGLALSDEALVMIGGRIAYHGPSADLTAGDVEALYAARGGERR